MSYGIDEVDIIFDEMNEKIDKTMQKIITALQKELGAQLR